MTKARNTLILFILSVFAGCTVSTDKFPEPGKLKREIANSIEIPFETGDAIVYESFIGICGNSSQDELNRYYEPHLNEQPYLDLLKLKTKRTIFCTGDSLYALMDSLYKNNCELETVWACFSKDKIVLSITGEAVTNQSVKIQESYSYNDDYIYIEKLFYYSDGEWKFKIVENKGGDD